MKKKVVKVRKFRQNYNSKYEDSNYESLEQWQEKNPSIKIIDTKLTQEVFTNYENYLLVTYEEEIPNDN